MRSNALNLYISVSKHSAKFRRLRKGGISFTKLSNCKCNTKKTYTSTIVTNSSNDDYNTGSRTRSNTNSILPCHSRREADRLWLRVTNSSRLLAKLSMAPSPEGCLRSWWRFKLLARKHANNNLPSKRPLGYCFFHRKLESWLVMASERRHNHGTTVTGPEYFYYRLWNLQHCYDLQW